MGDEFESEPPVMGGIGAMPLPYEPNDEEAEALALELAEKLARKRPCGFAPWPDE